MKSVLISIQPYYVFLIIAQVMGRNIGKQKTVEIRKNYPKSNDWNKIAKIYCSKNKKSFSQIPKEYQSLMQPFLGKVIGEFVCKKKHRIGKRGFDNNFDYCYLSLNVFGNDDIEIEITDIKKACISKDELNSYGANSNTLYAWHISDLVIYDKPKDLSEFKKLCNKKCDKCDYLDVQEIGAYEHTKEIKTCLNFIERPPQSWCYVEVLENG